MDIFAVSFLLLTMAITSALSHERIHGSLRWRETFQRDAGLLEYLRVLQDGRREHDAHGSSPRDLTPRQLVDGQKSLDQHTTMSVPIKPQLRGVLHQISLLRGARRRRVVADPGQWHDVLGLSGLPAARWAANPRSARSTTGSRAPNARRWWRRLDHSCIMILIAGTGTPLAVALPTDATRTFLLLWGGAALGVLRALVWITAPKPLVAVLALALAWFSSPFMPALRTVLGTTSVVWLLAGGVIYSLGAVVYALKRPDPWPTIFGYHEVFHTLVAVGAACHFVTVTRVVLGTAG